MRQHRMFREQLAALSEKARFAMAENREDLAEAAVSRQLHFEAQAERLDKVQADAASEAAHSRASASVRNSVTPSSSRPSPPSKQ